MSEETPVRRVDWRAANLRGTQLSGLNLQYVDFRGADVREVNFSGSDLSYSDFRGADATAANFQNAKLYGAKMQGVTAFRADFRNTDLRQSNFGGAYLDGAMMPPPRPPERNAEDSSKSQEKPSYVDFGEDWDQRVADRRQKAGNNGGGQNEQARGRVLPNEQRQQKKDNDRGRGR